MNKKTTRNPYYPSQAKRPAEAESTINDYILRFKNLFAAVWIISLTAGGLIILLYLATERIFPRGLTFGDSLLLVYSATMFGIVMLIGTLLGAAAIYWLFFLVTTALISCQKRRGTSADFEIHPAIKSNLFAAVSFFFTSLIIFTIYLKRPLSNPEYILTLVYFLATGIFLLAIFGIKSKNKLTLKTKSIFFVVMATAFMALTKPALLNITMIAIGVRSWPGELVTVDEEDKKKIEGISRLHGLTVDFCDIAGTNLQGTKDLEVVWHHIGEVSYVRIVGEKRKATVLMPLGRSVETYPSRSSTLNCP